MKPVKKNINYSFINKKFLFAVFFFGAFASLLYLFIMLFKPFVDGILVALIFAIMFYPMHKFIARKLKHKHSLAASLSVTIVIALVLIPASFLIWMLINESSQILTTKFNYKLDKTFLTQIENTPLPPAIENIKTKVLLITQRFNIDIKDSILSGVHSLGIWVASMGAAAAKNSVHILLNIFALIVSLFMFFKNGPKIVKEISKIVPMPEKYKAMLLERLYDTTAGVIKALILTAVVQGVIALFSYLVVGAPVPVLLGSLTIICALIPFGGTAIVWVPLTIYLFLRGQIPQAIFMALWGMFVISSVDNVLRPLFMGKSVKLPTSILFMALIGGLMTYGFRGLILGPIIGVCVFVFIQIYTMETADPKELQQNTAAK